MIKVRDYRCLDCKYEWERFAHSHDKIECPKCGGGEVTLIVSKSPSFKVTGQGAYNQNMKV